MIRKILVSLLVAVTTSHSQSVDLTIKRYGISVGNSREVHGARLNYRDSRLRQVNGLNATVWVPHQTSHGDVRGVALCLPETGARNLTGVGIGILGLGVERDGLSKGISMGAVSRIIGVHAKLSIALLNIASDLHGMQLGLIDIAKRNSKGLKILPIINFVREWVHLTSQGR